MKQTILRGVFLFGIWTWCYFAISAQSPQRNFYPIQQTDGLISDKNNYFFFQDSRSFIWIGSDRGFNRLDGTNIRQYTHSLKDSNNDIELNIQSQIYEDDHANLWFAIVNHLCNYTRIKDSFYIKKIYYQGKELTGEHRVIYYERPTHLLWLRIEQQIYSYNIQTEETHLLPFNTEAIFHTVDTTKSGIVQRFYGYSWENPGLEIISKDIEGDFHKTSYAKNLTDKSALYIRQVIPQNDSICWLFANNRLVRFNRLHPKEGKIMTGLSSPISFGLLIDTSQMILSTYRDGLLQFDLKKETITEHWKHDEAVPLSLISDSPRQLFLDHQRNLWINTRENGIQYTPLTTSQFTCPDNIRNKEMNFSSVVYFQHQLWCIAPMEGIFVFDQEMNLAHFFSDQDLLKKQIQMTQNARFDIINDELFLLPHSNIYQYDTAKKTWKKHGKNDPKILKLCPISKQKIIAETLDNLKKITLSEGYLNITPFHDLPTSDWYENLFYSKYSNKLICSKSNKYIGIYSVQNNAFKPDTSFVLESTIHCIWEDSISHLIWIGSRQGLHQLNIGQSTLKSIKISDENFSIYKIIGDKNGRIWYSGDKGIGCYDPASQNILKFTEGDGFLCNNFNPDAGCMDGNGNIWLGSNKGLTCFNPAIIRPYSSSPKVYIAHLKINNQTYKSDTITYEKKAFSLTPNDNTLLFELMPCNFYLPDQVKIQYRLQGLSNEWLFYNDENKAVFAGLPSNNYKLQWRTINANGIKSSIEGVQITIPPHFYQTWPFFILCFLGLIGIVFGATRFYYGQKIKEQKRTIEKQQAIHDERNRIADELHDDLGSGLSLIRVLSQTIEGKFDNPNLNKRTTQISETSDKLLHNMKDILWAMETKNNSLNNLINHIEKYTKSYLPMNNIDHICEVKKLNWDIELQGSIRRNIFLIVKESLHNIVKHADAKMVKIAITIEDNLIILSIKDNGKGIKKENIRTGGKGLKSIKKRAADVNGELTIHSEEKKGTTIIAKIPIS